MTASILREAAHALRKSRHPAIRQLKVESREDCIVIQGRVHSYYLKQMAQETVMPVRGSMKLDNRVAVG